MKAPERGARLTISASAARQFFDPERTKGLRIRVTDDTVEFKASGTRGGADVIPVEFRTRGGLAATIDPGGTDASDLFRSLRRAGYRENAPFFVLTESSRGWVGLDHHRSRHPPLNKPHMRLWMSSGAGGRGGARQREEPVEGPTRRKQRAKVGRPATHRGNGRRRRAESDIDWKQLSRAIIKAKSVIDRPPPVRRTQRSEVALERATNDVEQFRRLAEQILGVSQESSDAHLQAENHTAVAVSELDSAHEEMEVMRQELAMLRGSLEEAQQQREAAEEALHNLSQQTQRVEENLHPAQQRRRGGRRIRMPEPVNRNVQEQEPDEDAEETETVAATDVEPEAEHQNVQETEGEPADEAPGEEADLDHEEVDQEQDPKAVEGANQDHEGANHDEEQEGQQDEQPPDGAHDEDGDPDE